MSDLKFGRKAPKRHAAIQFKHILTGTLPEYPINADYLSIIANKLQMLGNDTYGDCVAVAIANERFLVTSALSIPSYMTLDQVYQIYKTQNPDFPNQDDGMDMQTLFEWMTKNSLPDGSRLLAFAQIDNTNLAELDAAIGIFGCIQLGITVTQANMDEFNAGKEWDNKKSPALGGHAVATGGETTKDLRIATWAEETGLLTSFLPQIEEAWVLIWDEYLHDKKFYQAIDLYTLAADYQAITGNMFPIQVPPPTPVPPPDPNPVPTPTPTPTPTDKQWLIDLLKELLTIKGLPKWVTLIIKTVLASIGG